MPGSDQKASASRAQSQLKSFAQAGAAACIAVTFTNPIEVVKTRLQLQGELVSRSAAKAVYRNSFHAFYLIAKGEGISSLQRGLLPAYFYQIIMNGVRFSEYDRWKVVFTNLLSKEKDKPHHVANIMAGVVSGLMGAFLGSPFFLIKTRLQSYSEKYAVGTQHKYRGVMDAVKIIYGQDGIRGIFTGVQAAMLRTGVGSGIQLSTYDRVRLFLTSNNFVPDNIFADLASSLTSGFMVCVGMNPFDVVSTRLYNQRLDHVTHKGTMYTGPIDCLIKTVKSEGIMGLYKGFFAHYLRIGPHTVLCFVFYEQLKRYFK